MTAIEILASLRARGVQVSVHDGRLRLVGVGVLPDALYDEIGARRHELIAAQLVADGRDILAALADRGIVVRLSEDGRPWAGPAELIDEADHALLAAHRDAVLAALRAEASPSQPKSSEVHRGQMVINGEYLLVLHIDVPGNDPRVVDEIADVLARHPGSDEVQLHIVSGGREVTMQVGERFRVTAGPAVKAELDACFGREVARLEAIQPRSVGANVGAGMSEVVPGTGDQAAAAELTADGTNPQPQTSPGSGTAATGGLVPDQEGRPASTGAEPTGGSQPGTVAPMAPFDGSDAQRRDPEPAGGANGGGEARPRIEAGEQAFDAEPVLVTTAAALERALPEILTAPVLGFDTEGTGLDPLTAKIRLVQLATGRRTYLIDVFRLPLPALQPVLDGARRLVGHNLKFDLRMLMAAGIRLPTDIGRRVSDTMLAGQLLGAGLEGQRHRLADLAQRYLGVELDKTEQVSDWSGGGHRAPSVAGDGLAGADRGTVRPGRVAGTGGHRGGAALPA